MYRKFEKIAGAKGIDQFLRNTHRDLESRCPKIEFASCVIFFSLSLIFFSLLKRHRDFVGLLLRIRIQPEFQQKKKARCEYVCGKGLEPLKKCIVKFQVLMRILAPLTVTQHTMRISFISIDMNIFYVRLTPLTNYSFCSKMQHKKKNSKNLLRNFKTKCNKIKSTQHHTKNMT